MSALGSTGLAKQGSGPAVHATARMCRRGCTTLAGVRSLSHSWSQADEALERAASWALEKVRGCQRQRFRDDEAQGRLSVGWNPAFIEFHTIVGLVEDRHPPEACSR
jgi:hypothetical protein